MASARPLAPEEYDPVIAAYDFEGPGYEPPPSWFVGMPGPARSPVSEMRFGDQVPLPGLVDEQIGYDDSLMTPELMAQLMEQLPSTMEPGAPADAAPAMDMTGIDDGQFAAELPSDSGGIDSLVVDPVEQPGHDALEAIVQAQEAPFELMQAAFDSQQALEQQAPTEPDQPDPNQMAQQFYDEQMQLLMNPFGMLGFGPGPG